MIPVDDRIGRKREYLTCLNKRRQFSRKVQKRIGDKVRELSQRGQHYNKVLGFHSLLVNDDDIDNDSID